MSSKPVAVQPVKVYQDPVTRQKFEGEAIVVTQDADGPNELGLVKCQVLFSPADPLVMRMVHEDDLRAAGLLPN